jgi:uncharacterized protein
MRQPSGARRDFKIEVSLPVLDDGLTLVEPVRGHIRLMRVGDRVLVTGELETVVELACSHCLSEFRLPVTFDVEEEFSPTLNIATGARLPLEPDQDSANLIDEHHILDLTEVVRQDIWVNLPASAVCQPGCKGLCAVCGQNLNEGSCSCEPDVVDARWAALLSGLTESD